MTELLTVSAGLFGWFVLGCVVLAAIDDAEQSLFKWARQAPYGLYVPTVMAWPAIFGVWFWQKTKELMK